MKWESGKRSIQDTSGAAFIYVAFAMFGIMGVASVAIDVGHWYATQRSAQAAADSAAVAGAFEAKWGGNAAAIETAAIDQAVLEGFAASAVTVNSPPTIAPNGAAPGAVEVIIEGPTVGFFGSFFVENPIAVSTRWVATQVEGAEVCFVVLKSGGPGVELDSGIHTTATGCTMQVESASSPAVRTHSGGSMAGTAALSVFIAGENEVNADSRLQFKRNHSATAVPTMSAFGAQRAAMFE